MIDALTLPLSHTGDVQLLDLFCSYCTIGFLASPSTAAAARWPPCHPLHIPPEQKPSSFRSINCNILPLPSCNIEFLQPYLTLSLKRFLGPPSLLWGPERVHTGLGLTYGHRVLPVTGSTRCRRRACKRAEAVRVFKMRSSLSIILARLWPPANSPGHESANQHRPDTVQILVPT